MHWFCIKLMTLLLPLTLIKPSQESILPSSITDKSPSHHQHHGSPSAFDDLSASQSPSSSSLSFPSSSSHSSSSSSSSSSSHLITPSLSSPVSLSSSDVETSDISSESVLNPDSKNYNDRFHLLRSEESHNSQSIPPTHNNQQQSARSSILLPKIYPSTSGITNPFTSSISFPYHSSNPGEGKSLDYATTLIREALEGPMMHDSNGDSSDYVESSSSSSPPRSSFSSNSNDGTLESMNDRFLEDHKLIQEVSEGIDRNYNGVKRVSNEETNSDSGASLDGEDINTVQPSEDELFFEVQNLIQFIRESAHLDDKGSSPKSRNNRNRLTLQMDYLQNLLDEYRQKQGSISLRHWSRGVSPPRLSVTSPIAVLRDALMEEIKRKKIQETQAKIAMNERILFIFLRSPE